MAMSLLGSRTDPKDSLYQENSSIISQLSGVIDPAKSSMYHNSISTPQLVRIIEVALYLLSVLTGGPIKLLPRINVLYTPPPKNAQVRRYGTMATVK